VLLAGGSAFGLDSAAGAMRFLEAAGVGFPTPYARVPVVPTAVLYDLGLGDPQARPTPEMAAAACRAASQSPVVEGSVGVGAGATVGKLLSVRCATKGGLGSWAEIGADGLVVGALAAVNSFGDVIDPGRRLIVAGARRAPERGDLLDTARQVAAGHMRPTFGATNTTLVVVATNARFAPGWLRRVAGWACDGLARCLSPAFTAVDGDVVVALASEDIEAEPHRVGLLAARVVVRAVLRAVEQAEPLGGVPAARDISPLALGGE
jgi:L-aminopeptidase/D-esterase-like protein